MSPLALFYLMLAGSPVFNTFSNEKSTFGGNFDELSIFNPEWLSHESSIFSESSTRYNSLLRKALRNPCHVASTRRSILRELAGHEESSIFETEMMPVMRNIRMIRHIAEVNPIMVEKLLTRPESRVVVEKLLRHAEPETLLLVEKLIRKTVPSYLREKVARRVVKNLIRSSIVAPRRSIISELYPTSTFESSNIFESPIFSTVFGAEEPMTRILIEKLLRRSEVPEVVLSKLIRKVVKSSIRRHHSELPVEVLSLLSTRRHSNLYKKVAVKQIEKVAELKTLLNVLRVESHISTPSVYAVRRIVKLVKDLSNPERVIVKEVMKKALRHENVEVYCNMCENVCESTHTLVYSKVCSVCHEVCPTTTTPFGVSSRVMNKERLVKKLIKKIVKAVKYNKVEKVCRVCENICESSLSTVSPIVEERVCRICESVCEHSTVSRHVESKVLRRLVNSVESPLFSTSSIFGARRNVEEKLINKVVKSIAYDF